MRLRQLSSSEATATCNECGASSTPSRFSPQSRLNRNQPLRRKEIVADHRLASDRRMSDISLVSEERSLPLSQPDCLRMRKTRFFTHAQDAQVSRSEYALSLDRSVFLVLAIFLVLGIPSPVRTIRKCWRSRNIRAAESAILQLGLLVTSTATTSPAFNLRVKAAKSSQ